MEMTVNPPVALPLTHVELLTQAVPHPAADDAPASRAADVAAADREARIRAAAHTLYEQRGCLDGHDLDDWLKAEAMVDAAAEADAGAATQKH